MWAILPTYTRRKADWSMNQRMKAQWVNDALLMAIWKRKPHRGLTWHTDRGSQYASDSHRAILKKHHLIQSMSRKGNCWDNAVSESFFHTLKTELVHHTASSKQEQRLNRLYFNISKYFIIEKESILLMTICHL